jgi:3-oxoacyl-[acyl-carrier protein] reductase
VSAVVVVLGASRGIGAATALMFARQGARLALGARDGGQCAALAAQITAQGGQAVGMACDATEFEQVQTLTDTALTHWGAVSVLINNAGTIQPIAALADSDPAEFAKSIKTNLLGTYNGMRAVLAGMRAKGSGVVINVSSGAAHRPLEGWSAYCAGKAGAAMLTQAAALELQGTGVRVTGFRPGTVDTGMQAAIRASGINPVSRLRPEEHFRPWQPAHVLTWLASAEAADLHGQEVDIRDPEIQRRSRLATARPLAYV